MKKIYTLTLLLAVTNMAVAMDPAQPEPIYTRTEGTGDSGRFVTYYSSLTKISATLLTDTGKYKVTRPLSNGWTELIWDYVNERYEQVEKLWLQQEARKLAIAKTKITEAKQTT